MSESKAGWLTTSRTKPVMIDGLEAGLRRGELKVASMALLDELMTYSYHDNGETGAIESYHDDLVVAAGIAWAVKGEVPRRWTAQELEEFYREASDSEGKDEDESIDTSEKLFRRLGW